MCVCFVPTPLPVTFQSLHHIFLYFIHSQLFWGQIPLFKLYISIYITVLLYTYARFLCVFALYWLHCLSHSSHYIIYFWTSSTLIFLVKSPFFKLYISIYITVLLYTYARFSCLLCIDSTVCRIPITTSYIFELHPFSIVLLNPTSLSYTCLST